jgi:hypothetical protein
VPLVAAGMGMYHFPTDHYFWEFLAYCAGTGGSVLIIGSAAGIAVMGLEKIDFIWYLKKISWIALLGYFAGAGTFIAEKAIREKIGKQHETTILDIQNSKAVEDFLLKNTYYVATLLPDETGQMITDSIAYNFLRYTDKRGNLYFGMSWKRYEITKDETSYRWQGSMDKCECTIVAKDSLALINFCVGDLELSQTGRLYILTETGREEIKRK